MRSILLTAVLVLACQARALAADSCDYGKPHPGAPREMSQFAFLIGHHRVEARGWKDGGWAKDYQEAHWNGRYILGGMAIMDEWFDEDPAKNPAAPRGVNVRMYNPETGRWHIMWQYTPDKVVVELAAKLGEDGKMHLERLTHKIERKVHFDMYAPGHWARIDYRKNPQTGQFEPKYKLEAFRVPCKG